MSKKRKTTSDERKTQESPAPETADEAEETAAEPEQVSDDTENAAEVADGGTSEDEAISEDEPEQKKTNRFVEFFLNWGSAMIFLGALVFVCILLGLAIGLGGDIYDKVAFVWTAAFVCEFVAYLKNRNTKTLIAMIITVVLAVCSAVAYGLELAEIIP